MPRTHLVSSISASEKTVKKILQTSPVIGVSVKGAEIGSKGGSIHLVVVSASDGVHAFDVRRDRNIVLDGGLIRLLQSTDVLKVIHDCGPVSAALHFEFGVKLRNCFDTQTAYSVILEQQGLPPRMISFFNLCSIFGIQLHEPTPQLQQLLREDQNVWARRPVPRDVLDTAASSVLPLTACLYEKLNNSINEDYRERFNLLCEENVQSHIFRISTAKKRKQEKSVLFTKCLHKRPVMKLTAAQRQFVRGSFAEHYN